MIMMIFGASLSWAATCALDRARLEMNAAAANLFNTETTRTPEGGPYRYRRVDCGPDGVCRIVSELRERLVHAPSHVDADADGYVHYPAIDVEFEKAQMRAAIARYDKLQK